MSIQNDVKKTIRYAKKNGCVAAFFATMERIQQRKTEQYVYVEPSEKDILFQKQYVFANPHKISILVPTYETNPVFLRALVDSLQKQTYPNFELILADASESGIVKNTVDNYTDARIIYQKLEKNDGISENTNQALQYATGDYCGLLDHDDLLTQDALFEMAYAIEQAEQTGIMPAYLYSDEDKCDWEGKQYFDYHQKQDFNLDLLLTNNYICHFLVVETNLLKKTGFRKAYDGAQDFDLVLRLTQSCMGPFQIRTGTTQAEYQCGVKAITKIQQGLGWIPKHKICHIPKVLYHWRCHTGSTADHPESKMYAYEAGRKALEDFYEQNHIHCEVIPSMHLGFYRAEYQGQLLEQREDIAAVGGLLVQNGKIVAGGYRKDGAILYEQLPQYYAGAFNRAHLMQDVDAVDIRFLKLAERWHAVYEEVVGIPYEDAWKQSEKQMQSGTQIRKTSVKQAAGRGIRQFTEQQCREKSIALCREIRRQGGRILLDPLYHCKL